MTVAKFFIPKSFPSPEYFSAEKFFLLASSRLRQCAVKFWETNFAQWIKLLVLEV